MPRSITGEVRTVAPDPAFADAVLLVRADAGPAIGAGRVMRCLAIAEAWIELGGRVVFASAELPVQIGGRVSQLGSRVVPVSSSETTAALAVEVGARFAIVDGHHLGPEYQQDLGAAGARVLVIDDLGESATDAADVILNPNATPNTDLYRQLRGITLLGPTYALIRRELRGIARGRILAETARHILVSFGSGDAAELSPIAIDALAEVEGVHVRVVAGADRALVPPSHAKSIIEVVPWLHDLAGQMRWADLAIVAAGSTCWELAACGVPLIAVPASDSQLAVGDLGIGIPVARDAFSAETLRALVSAVMSDQIWRGKLHRKGPELVDGRGAFRVCGALRGVE